MTLTDKQLNRLRKNLPEGYKKVTADFFAVTEEHVEEIAIGVMVDKAILAYLLYLATIHHHVDTMMDAEILLMVKALGK